MELGKSVSSQLLPGAVIALHGPLGAGKTTFVKGLALGLGIDEIVNSPTFTLISEYTGDKKKLYHMDLYRIDSFDDFIMIGGDEIINGNDITVIEWAEKIKNDLPEHTIDINIYIIDNLDREIRIEGIK